MSYKTTLDTTKSFGQITGTGVNNSKVIFDSKSLFMGFYGTASNSVIGSLGAIQMNTTCQAAKLAPPVLAANTTNETDFGTYLNLSAAAIGLLGYALF